MKKKKLIIIISVVIFVLLITLGCFFMGKKIADKEAPVEEEKVENKIEDIKTTETDKENKLEEIVLTSKVGTEITSNVSFSNIYSSAIYEQILLGGMTDEYKIMMGLDRIQKDVGYSYMLETPEEYMGNKVSTENLDKVIKEIFGNDTKVNHKQVYLTDYDSSNSYYTVTPMGFAGGNFEYIIQVPYKIEEDSDNCYLYAYEVFVQRKPKSEELDAEIETNIYYDAAKTLLISKVEDERINNEDYQVDVINTMIGNNTINKESLSKLRYTLKKENKNYYLVKIEKIK